MKKTELGLYSKKVFQTMAFSMTVLLLISFFFLPAFAAEKEVLIKINYNGLRLNDQQKWEIVPLQGTFKVFLNQEQVADELKANGEPGLVSLEDGLNQGTFTFEEINGSNSHYAFDSANASYGWVGENEFVVNVWAYAKQGLFSLEQYVESLKTANQQGLFEVYSEKGENILQFDLADGEKTYSLPEGKYTLHQKAAPDGIMPVEDVTFEVRTYQSAEDITVVSVNHLLSAQWQGSDQANQKNVQESATITKEGIKITLPKPEGEIGKTLSLGVALPKGSLIADNPITVNGLEEKAVTLFKGNQEDFVVFTLKGEGAFEDGRLTLLIPAQNLNLFKPISLYSSHGNIGEMENSSLYMDVALEKEQGQYGKKDLFWALNENENTLLISETFEENQQTFTWQRANGSGVSFLHLPENLTLIGMPAAELNFFVSEEKEADQGNAWTLAHDYQGDWASIKSLAATQNNEITFTASMSKTDEQLIFALKNNDEAKENILVTLPQAYQNMAESLVYQDKNNNGQKDEEENGLANQPVFIKYQNNPYWAVSQTNNEGKFFYEEGQKIEKLYLSLPKHAYSFILEQSQTGLYALKEQTDITAVPVVTRASLTVAITNRETGAPIALTAVQLFAKGASPLEGITDEKGTLLFEGLEEGTYTLNATLNDTEAHKGFISKANIYEKELLIAQGEQVVEEILFTPFSQIQVVSTGQGQLPDQSFEVRLSENDTLIEAKEMSLNQQIAFAPLYQGEYNVSFLSIPDGMILAKVNGEEVLARGMYETTIRVQQTEEKIELTWIRPSAIILNEITGLSKDALLEGRFTGPEERSFSFAYEEATKTIENLLPGEYTLYITLGDNVILEGFENENWLLQNNEIVTKLKVAPEEKVYAPKVSLSTYGEVYGSLWDDVKAQGVIDETTLPLGGVTLWLEKQEGKSLTVFTEKERLQSDEEGMYHFKRLSPGRYRVIIEIPKASTITTQQAGTLKKQQYILEPFTLKNGEEKKIEKIGIAVPSGAEITAFWDTNNNGIKGPYEPAIAGTKVEIINENEEVITQGVTDEAGKAIFRELPLGQYRAKIILPQGYWFGNTGNPQEKTIYSSVAKIDSTQGISTPFTVTQGVVAQVGAGGVKTGAISGIMWEDLNGNGIMDGNEPGMAGASLEITGNKTGTTYTLTPNDQGEYVVELRPGSYKMLFKGPQGYIFTRYSSVGRDMRSYFTQQGENQGEIQVVVQEGEKVINPKAGWMKSATLQGQAFIDENYNGKMDEQEQPLKEVQVTMVRTSGELIGKGTTDDQGRFSFENLRGEDYTLQVTLPEGTLVYSKLGEGEEGLLNHFTAAVNSKTTGATVTVQDGIEKEIGIGALYPGTLAGRVFVDESYNGLFEEGEKGLEDIKISLYNTQGALIQESKTGAMGEYLFTNLMPQRYYIEVTVPEKHTVTLTSETQNITQNLLNTNGQTAPFALAMGEEKENLFFGLVQSGAIRGSVFYDFNDDGLWNEEEKAYEGLEIQLYNEKTGEVLEKTAADSQGSFIFTGVLPGEYAIGYTIQDNEAISKNLQAGYQGHLPYEMKGTGFALTMGQEVELTPLGVVPLGSVAAFAFFDEDGNGIWDEGEKPLANLTMEYVSSQKEEDKVIITPNEEGLLSAQGLRPGEYHFVVTLKENMVFSRQGEDALVSQTGQTQGEGLVNIQAGEQAAGYLLAVTQVGGVEGTLWLDENDNGIKDNQEPAIEGNNIRVIDELTGEEVRLTTSDENGNYAIEGLLPGLYSLKTSIPQGYGAGKMAQGNLFMDDGEDGLQSRSIVVKKGEITPKINGAMIKYTSIKGRAWTEKEGKIVPLEGVVLRLKEMTQGEIVAQSMTAAGTGEYLFSGLRPGEYQIEAVLPSDYLFVNSWDGKITEQGHTSIILQGMEGSSEPFILTMGEDLSQMDMGAVVTGQIGDTAWIDENENGLQDTGERVLSGVEVTLYQNQKEIATTTTDENGYYLFENIYPTNSQIKVKMPKEVIPTQINQEFPLLTSALVGYNDGVAYTAEFELQSAVKHFHCDLGFALVQQGVYPEGAVFLANQNWSW